MDKFYFKNSDSETCHNKQYFIDYMEEHNLKKFEVYEAIKETIGGYFWCNKLELCCDDIEGTCGKWCKDYTPKNGKNGCCKYYSKIFHRKGKLIKLEL